MYFLGLSLRNTSKALTIFKDGKRSYVSGWNSIQRFGYAKYTKEKKSICFYNIDETVIQIGNEHFCWLWFCIEPVHISRFGIYISQKREIVNK